MGTLSSLFSVHLKGAFFLSLEGSPKQEADLGNTKIWKGKSHDLVAQFLSENVFIISLGRTSSPFESILLTFFLHQF